MFIQISKCLKIWTAMVTKVWYHVRLILIWPDCPFKWRKSIQCGENTEINLPNELGNDQDEEEGVEDEEWHPPTCFLRILKSNLVLFSISSQLHNPWLKDIVDSDIGLTLSPPVQGIWIWLQFSSRQTERKGEWKWRGKEVVSSHCFG